MNQPYRILCVCMNNVCRSPMAEVVLRQMLTRCGLGGRVEVASAATHGFRVGDTCDAKTHRAAMARGYDLSQMRAQKIGWQDFEYFDLILPMDQNNLANLRRMTTEEQQRRIRLFLEFAPHFAGQDVPDPYLTLGASFDDVLDRIEDGARGIVALLEQQLAGRESEHAAFADEGDDRFKPAAGLEIGEDKRPLAALGLGVLRHDF